MKKIVKQVNDWLRIELKYLDEIYDFNSSHEHAFSYEIYNYSSYEVEELRNKIFSSIKNKFDKEEFNKDGKNIICSKDVLIELAETENTNEYKDNFIEIRIVEIL